MTSQSAPRFQHELERRPARQEATRGNSEDGLSQIEHDDQFASRPQTDFSWQADADLESQHSAVDMGSPLSFQTPEPDSPDMSVITISRSASPSSPSSSAYTSLFRTLNKSGSKWGPNWTQADRACFADALYNNNPWICKSVEDALEAWQFAIRDTNEDFVRDGREVRVEGAFVAQWKQIMKDVQDRRRRSDRATGANFEDDDEFATMFLLFEHYKSSTIKLRFLSLLDKSPKQVARQEMRKRKEAVDVQRAEGRTAQSTALQRLRERMTSSQSTEADGEDIAGSPSSSSALKRRRVAAKESQQNRVCDILEKLVDISESSSAVSRREFSDLQARLDTNVTTIMDKLDRLTDVIVHWANCSSQ